MSLALPLASDRRRELFDVAQLVALTTGVEALPHRAMALRSARRTMEGNPAIRRVAVICLDSATDQVELLTVGPRGGWKREWRFGPVPRSARLA